MDGANGTGGSGGAGVGAMAATNAPVRVDLEGGGFVMARALTRSARGAILRASGLQVSGGGLDLGAMMLTQELFVRWGIVSAAGVAGIEEGKYRAERNALLGPLAPPAVYDALSDADVKAVLAVVNPGGEATGGFLGETQAKN